MRASEASVGAKHPAAANLVDGRYPLNELLDLDLVGEATPVLVKGRHMASLFTGQILFDKPDAEKFRQQAVQCGYDPGDYLAALTEGY